VEGKAAAERILSALMCNPGFDSRTRGAAPSRPDFVMRKRTRRRLVFGRNPRPRSRANETARAQIAAKKCRSGGPKTRV